MLPVSSTSNVNKPSTKPPTSNAVVPRQSSTPNSKTLVSKPSSVAKDKTKQKLLSKSPSFIAQSTSPNSAVGQKIPSPASLASKTKMKPNVSPKQSKIPKPSTPSKSKLDSPKKSKDKTDQKFRSKIGNENAKNQVPSSVVAKSTLTNSAIGPNVSSPDILVRKAKIFPKEQESKDKTKQKPRSKSPKVATKPNVSPKQSKTPKPSIPSKAKLATTKKQVSKNQTDQKLCNKTSSEQVKSQAPSSVAQNTAPVSMVGPSSSSPVSVVTKDETKPIVSLKESEILKPDTSSKAKLTSPKQEAQEKQEPNIATPSKTSTLAPATFGKTTFGSKGIQSSDDDKSNSNKSLDFKSALPFETPSSNKSEPFK